MKSVFSAMCALLLAFSLTAGLSSCAGDDDDDEGSSYSSVTLTFYGNGGTTYSGESYKTVTTDSNTPYYFSNASSYFTRDGYTLLGWANTKTATEAKVAYNGFSVFVYFFNAFLLLLSFLIFCLVPGPAGLVLSGVNALRLRLYKYDWLDAHPENKSFKLRKKIPWAALVKEDEENIGPRNFKSFFMPWKNDN